MRRETVEREGKTQARKRPELTANDGLTTQGGNIVAVGRTALNFPNPDRRRVGFL